VGTRPPANIGGSNFAYLIRIFCKYGVDLKGLLECLWKAWKEGSSACGSIIVQLRMRGDDHGIFLIKRGEELVAQLRFEEEELKRMRRLKDSTLSSLVEAWKEKEYQKLDKNGERKSETLKIGELKPGLKGVGVRGKVVEKSEPKMVDRDGRRLLFSLAVVADGTGTIEMPLWGRRVGMVSVGDVVLVEGVQVEEYLGELQLRVGSGKITVE
jgi:hypothetical protein